MCLYGNEEFNASCDKLSLTERSKEWRIYVDRKRGRKTKKKESWSAAYRVLLENESGKINVKQWLDVCTMQTQSWRGRTHPSDQINTRWIRIIEYLRYVLATLAINQRKQIVTTVMPMFRSLYQSLHRLVELADSCFEWQLQLQRIRFSQGLFRIARASLDT